MNLDDFTALAHARRTSMAVQADVAVPRATVLALCELAQFAPNHKRTWPWRFALAEGDGRTRLGNVVADAMEANGDAPEKVAQRRSTGRRSTRSPWPGPGCSGELWSARRTASVLNR